MFPFITGTELESTPVAGGSGGFMLGGGSMGSINGSAGILNYKTRHQPSGCFTKVMTNLTQTCFEGNHLAYPPYPPFLSSALPSQLATPLATTRAVLAHTDALPS
jgi:hypothetical protein